MHPHQHDVIGSIAKHLHVEGTDQAKWKTTMHPHESSADTDRQRECSGAQEYESIGDKPLQQDGAILPEQREIERLLEIISHRQPTRSGAVTRGLDPQVEYTRLAHLR